MSSAIRAKVKRSICRFAIILYSSYKQNSCQTTEKLNGNMIGEVKHLSDNKTVNHVRAAAVKQLHGARKNHYSERYVEETRDTDEDRCDGTMSGGCDGRDSIHPDLLGSEISISTRSTRLSESTGPCDSTGCEEGSWTIKPMQKSKKQNVMYRAPIVKRKALEARKELDARKPFCSVVRKELNLAQSATTTVDKKKVDYNPDIFYQLHEESSWKNKEGRDRRESVRIISEERALSRNGAYRETGQISADHGSRLYYVGMMHKVHKERRVAEQAANLGKSHTTRLNLQQMIEYCFKMQQDEMNSFIHNL